MINKKLSNWLNKNVSSDNASKKESQSNQTNQSQPVKTNHPNKHNNRSHHRKPHFKSKGGFGNKMRIIPLGGLEEVGKNIMAIEYKNDIIVIDCGMSFAGPEMLGVDYIVPDVSYLEKNKRKIKGIIITHGHLDHIGAIQYIIPKLGNPPIYATKLTKGLIKNRLKDFNLDKTAKLNEFGVDSKLNLGSFKIEFFRVNHSIPDGVGVYVRTEAGSLVHTGDFKFDYSPAMDEPADLQRIAEIGREGVDVLLIDSTSSTKPGFCKSEKEIGDNIEDIVSKTKGRLIIASFASLIGRVNQICNFASKYNRKVFLSGRSMIENMKIAEELGYTTYPKGVVKKIGPQADKLPPSQVIIVTTGAQGESLSALTRMAIGEHKHIKIRQGDTVLISANPIPGNELAIVNVINNLYAQGARVITNGQMDIHVSGHGHEQETKLMYSLIKPRCYVPIHGELYMRMGHAAKIREIAEPHMTITMLENNGDVLEVSKQGVRKSKQKIPANDILVDGLGFGDIGSRVIKDRKVMSNDGVLIILFQAYQKTKRLVGDPDIISRGFVYMKESQAIANETKKVAKKAFEKAVQENKTIDLKELKRQVAINTNHFLKKRLRREPMILPIVMYI